jgi:hypothetical protein
MPKDELDNGLGLAAFVRGSSTEGDTPSQSDGKPSVSESTQEKTADTKPATTEPDKKEGKEKAPSPSDTESQVRSKVEEALAGKSDEKEAKEAPAAEKKDDTQPPAKEEQAKGSNWDSDENPFKAQSVSAMQRIAALEDQLRNTRNYSNEVNKQNRTLQRRLERMEKKIDGTYDPEEEKRLDAEEQKQAEQQGGSVEDEVFIAELKGTTKASLAMAYEKLGKEKVDAEIAEFDRLFKNNPLMMHRVTTSRRPIQEALKVLTEYRTAQKYGTGDLEELIQKVREEAKAELRPQLIEEVTKEIMSKLDLKNKETTGIRNVRGAARESVAERLGDGKDEDKPLNVLFPG